MSSPPASERDLTRLYDGLARYNWLLRRLRGARPGQGLEMHKRLEAGSGPGAGTAGLDAWLLDEVAPAPDARVLDLGCGFGATLFAWARRNPRGRQSGLSLSPFQIRMAEREARRLGLLERCRFLAGNFDEVDAEAAGGCFDAVVSIETLFHSPDLEHTLRRWKHALAPGGRLILVEDMATDGEVGATRDGRELLDSWATRRLHARGDYLAAIDSANLVLEREVDLSGQVVRSDSGTLGARAARLRRLHRLTPWPLARRILEAYLGGLALERLYASGRMSYRVMIAGPRSAA